MENNYLNNMLKTARSKQVRRRMVALFSALVLILTTNQLKLKADTLERRAACGSVEHQHSEECHDEAGNIVCGLEEHIHTDACFQERPKADEVMPEAALPIEDGGLESGDDEFIVSSEIEIPPEESDSFELGEPEEPAPETDVEEETAAVESFVTPVYDFNGASYALLSDILAGAGLDMDKNAIDEVGESVIDDDQQLSISVVKDGEEYTVTALRDFIDDDMVELVVFTKDRGVYLVNLKNGIEYEPAEAAVDEEQPVPVEPAPVDDEDRTSAATTDDEDTAEDQAVSVEPAPVEEEEQATVEVTEYPSIPVENETSEPVIEQTDGEAEETAEPTSAPEPDLELTDEQSAADDSLTATAEPINESITENRENEDSPQEAVEDEEQPGAAVEDEEQPEESVTEDEKQPEEDASDEAEEQPEEDASGEAEERPEESVSGEAEEHPDEASGTVYTATIDLTDRSAPFSLLEMMGAAAPAEELLVQEEQQAEEALAPSDWTLEYDEERLDVIFEDGDYLITPRASFEAATIFVGAGDSYVLNLVNCQLPLAYPARSFEGSTATMTVKVTADEGAFPEGTIMEVADVEDEATISDIAGAVEGENVTVNRVHAVDITFRDAEGQEIEPLIPISVVMSVNEQAQSADAVVVHVDGEGNAEVLEQTGAGNEVAFDAEAFSVYAVVITERYISANGESYNIQVSYNSEAGIPDGAALRVEEVVDQEYLDMASAALGADKAVRLARFFDISIMADGGEIQPDGSVTVKVTLEDAVEADEVKAVHFGEDNVDVINVEEDSGTLSFQAESFSVYGIVYTVDFEFEGYTFSMPGGGRIWLTALLKALNADFSAANVRCISFSNPELVRLIPSIDGDNWLLMSLAPFNTEETLTLTLDGGRIVTIAVTDAEGDEPESAVHDISGFLTRAEITDSTTGQVIGDSDGTLAKLHKSREYAIHLSFAEDEYGEQFPDEGTMKFFLPEAVDLPEGTNNPFSGSFDIDLGRGHTLTGNSVVLHHAVKDAEGKVTTPAYIEITWNAASSEYERLIASPRAAFNLNYYFTINTDYDELKFSDTISVPITEDPEYHVTINKRLHDADANIVPYDNETGIATYQLEVQAEGKAKDINVTDTLGKALDYVMDGTTVGVSVVYKNKNGGEPSRTYPDDNMTVTSGTGSDEQMIVHFNELADGDKAILTYQAKVDFTKLTAQDQVKVDTTNTAQATAGNVTTEETTVSLEGHIQYLSVQKDTGTIDKRHEDDTDPYWLVPYKVVYNHERKVPVVDAVIKDEIYVGDIHAAAFYSDETHPFKVKVYKAGTTYSETTDSDGNITGWTFNGNNNAIATRTYQFSTDSKAAEPSVDEDGNTVPGTIVVTPSAVSDDLTDTPTSWTWTVPTIVDEDAGVTAATPLTYEITYYTKVSLGMVNEGQVGNRVTEDHSGDTSDAGHYVGTKPSNGLKVKKSVLDTNPNGSKVDPAYTRWEISFDRTASKRTVVEDTLPRSENGSYADTYYVDTDHPTLFDGLYDEEACVVNANNAGRVIFTFYKDTNKTQPGMKASDDSHQTITITFYTKNSEGWMTKTAEDGSVEQEHVNRVRLIQNSTQAWNRATATPKEPKLVKTVEPAGTVYNRTTGIYQPVFKYTLKLVGLDDTMFQNNELTITDEFDAFFTPVLSSTLAGDMSIGGDGKKDGVELPDYGYTGSVSGGEEVLKQTVPAGKEDKAIHVAISDAALNDSKTKKTITFTVDQYNKEGEGSHAADWNPWRKSETADGKTVYTGAPSYGYAYQMSYYLMITAEDMQKLAEKVYEDDSSESDPTAKAGKITLTNRAHVTNDVEFLHSEDIPVTIDVRPINKERTYSSNAELATYTLTINAQKIRLNNGEPYIVKDEFDNLAVDYATISYVTDPVEARDQITHSYTGNVGTFMVPDQTKVTITYKAWPVGKKGDTVEMKNTATVMSYAAKKNESVTLKADHEGTAESYGVRVLKYSNDDMHKPLGRAVFQLLRMDENGNKVPVLYTLPSSKTSPDEWNYVKNYKASDYIAGGSDEVTFYPTPQNHSVGDPVFFITKDRNESVSIEEDETWGIAEVMLSQARDGVALSKGVRYYLREVETPEGHIKENTDWTFIIADNDDFDNYVYSNDSVLKISNPTQNNDLVVEKDFYDHTGLVTKAGMYATEFEIIGKNDAGKVIYKKTMTYGNFKVVDEPQDDGTYVRKYKMIVGHDELPTGHYTVTEKNYPEPGNTVLTTTLDNPSGVVTLVGKVAEFDWTKGTSTGPLNVHFVNTYEDEVTTKVDVKVKKVWSGEAVDISNVSFDLYRTTDKSKVEGKSAAELRAYVQANNLLPVETNLKFDVNTAASDGSNSDEGTSNSDAESTTGDSGSTASDDETSTGDESTTGDGAETTDGEGTSATTEYVKTIQKADKVSDEGDAYYYFVLERAVAGYEDQYTDSYSMSYPTEGAQELTITNTHVTPTTSFTFGKLWAGPDDTKHMDTLAWPDNKTITVQVQRRPEGYRAAKAAAEAIEDENDKAAALAQVATNYAVDDSYVLTYTITKNQATAVNTAIEANEDSTAPKLTVLSSGNYSHYQFKLDDLPKYKEGTTKWEYFVTETSYPNDGDVAFDAPKYGYVDGIITAVTTWNDAASRETDASKVSIVESVINRAKPTKSYEIPVEKALDGSDIFDLSNYDGKFTFELYQMVKVAGSRNPVKQHIAYVKNVENAKFTVTPDLTEGLTYHARKKKDDGTYEDHPYFDGTYTYYIREVQPGEQNVEEDQLPVESTAEDGTVTHKKFNELTTEEKAQYSQQAVDGVTFTTVVATVEYKITLDWETSTIEAVRTIKYSNTGKSTDESVTFTNKYDEGKRPLKLTKLWDDDGNRDGLRGDVKFRVRAEADYTDAQGSHTLKWPWPETTETATGDVTPDEGGETPGEGAGSTGGSEQTGNENEDGETPAEELFKEIVMSVGAKNSDAHTEKNDTLPVYIDSHPISRYYIEEVEMPEGYSLSSSTASPWGVTTDDRDNPLDIEFTAENKHDTAKITSVQFTKTWDDDSNRDNQRPSLADFLGNLHLYSDANSGTDITVPAASHVETVTTVDSTTQETTIVVYTSAAKTDKILEAAASGDTYTVTFFKGNIATTDKNGDPVDAQVMDLPMYRDQGTLMKYYVLEDAVGSYTSATKVGERYKSDETGENDYAIDMTNTLPVDRTVQVTLNKTWVDANNQDGTRPSRLEAATNYLNYITLYANGVAVYQNDDWVTPETGDANYDFISDIVTGLSGPTLTAPTDVTQPYTVEFSGLPLNTKGAVGQAIVYTLEETQIGANTETDADDNYNMTTGAASATTGYALTDGADTHSKSIAMENKHQPTQVRVTATKKWEHHNHVLTDAEKGDNGKVLATLRLLASTPDGKSYTFPEGYEDLTADRRLVWDSQAQSEDRKSVTWDNLPKYAPGQEGKLLTYTVDEVSEGDIQVPDGYHLVIKNEPVLDTSGVIQIIAENEYQETEISATKQWVGDDHNRDNERAVVTLQLRRKVGNGEWEQVPANKVVADQLKVERSTDASTWTVADYTQSKTNEATLDVDSPVDYQRATWSHLPAYIGNQPVVYDVQEVEIDHYTKTDNEAPAAALKSGSTYQTETAETIKNTHTLETTEAHFKKVWDRKGYPTRPTDADFVASLRLWAKYHDAATDTDVIVEVDSADANSIAPGWKNNIRYTNNATDAKKSPDLDTYEVQISGLPKFMTGQVGSQITYYMSENAPTDYNDSYPDHTGDTLAAGKALAAATAAGVTEQMTNTHKTANLKLSKTVVSDLAADATREFIFEITSEPKITGTGYALVYSSVAAMALNTSAQTTIDFTNGVATVKLKLRGGDDVTIQGLPTSVTYTVKESADNDFATTSVPTNGQRALTTTDENETLTVDFTNTRKKADLEVTKSVVSAVKNDTDGTNKFNFTVTLTGLTAEALTRAGDYSATGNPATSVSTSSGNAVYTFQLGEGDTWTAKDLPAGVSYTVVEDTYDNYTTTKTGDTGTLAQTGSTAAFTNTRKVGSLRITKDFLNDGRHAIPNDKNIAFTFEVTLTPPAGTALNYSATGDAAISCGTLKQGTTDTFIVTASKARPVTLTGIPVGTQYEIREVSSDATSSFALDTTVHTGTIIEGAGNAVLDKVGDNAGVAITAQNIPEKAFANNDRKTGDLVLQKEVDSPVKKEKENDLYTIHVALNPVPEYAGPYVLKKSWDATDGSVNFTNGAADIQVKTGGYVRIVGIPVDVGYTITEEGYTDFAREFYPVTLTTDAQSETVTAGTKLATQNVTGTIADGEVKGGKVKNIRNKGNLELSKTVVSHVNADKTDGWFLFEVKAESEDANKRIYNDTYGDLTFNNNVAYVWLQHGDANKKTATGLPAGFGYTVTELATVPAGCTMLPDGVTAQSYAAYAANFNFGSASNGTIGNGTTVKAPTTNVRKTGTLTINKNFTGYQDHSIPGDNDLPFTFTVVLDRNAAADHFADNPDTWLKKVVGGNAVTLGDGESIVKGNDGKITVTVKSSVSHPATIKGIPVGTGYTVSEVLTGSDNFDLRSSNGTTGTVGLDTETVGKPAQSVTESFTNDRKTGNLAVKKVVDSPVIAEANTDNYDIVVTLDKVPNKLDGYTLRKSDGTNSTVNFVKASETATTCSATISLKHGQTATIVGLPTDLTYTITEPGYTDFDKAFAAMSVSDTNEVTVEEPVANATQVEDTIKADETHGAQVTNTRKTGQLTVSKSVVSDVDADDDQYYWFKVELDGSTVDTRLYNDPTVTNPDPVAYTAADGGLYFNNNVAYVKLKHGESVTAYGLPVGHTYKVTEITTAAEFADIPESIQGTGTTFDEDYAAKFVPSWEKTVAGSETPVKSPINSGKVFTDGGSTEEKFDKITAAASTVAFTNTRKTGDLKLTKTVTSPFGTEKEAYYFLKVELKTAEGAESGSTVAVNGTYTVRYHSIENELDTPTDRKVTFVDGAAVVPVQGNGDKNYVEIHDLPIAVTYTVTEVTGSQHDVKNADSTAFTATNEYDPAIFNKDDANKTGTIAEKIANTPTSNTATVTNARKVQPIAMKKVSTADSIGNGLADNTPGLSGAEFELTPDGANPEWKVYLKSTNDGKFIIDTDVQKDGGTGHTGTLPGGMDVDEDGYLVLPASEAGVVYWLKETKAPDGYNLLTEPVEITVKSDDVTYDAKFDGQTWTHCNDTTGKTRNDLSETNTVRTISLLIPNSPGAKLPSTGGPGTVLYTASGLSVIALALALLLRRKRDW